MKRLALALLATTLLAGAATAQVCTPKETVVEASKQVPGISAPVTIDAAGGALDAYRKQIEALTQGRIELEEQTDALLVFTSEQHGVVVVFEFANGCAVTRFQIPLSLHTHIIGTVS